MVAAAAALMGADWKWRMNFSSSTVSNYMANQINDYGQYFKKISLRNAYDVLLFSQKTDAVKALEGYSKLFNPLNNCISTCNIIFGNLRQLSHTPTRASKAYYKQFDRLMSHPLYNRLHYKFVGGFLQGDPIFEDVRGGTSIGCRA